MAEATKTNLKGSCKCGFVKYTADIKVDAEGAIEGNRCNCTFCTKLATTYAYLESAQDIKLIEPGSWEELGSFAPRVKTCVRHFCQHCGSQIAMLGYYEIEGRRRDMAALNIATIDQPQGNVELSKTKLKYFGMLEGLFETKPEPYKGGLP